MFLLLVPYICIVVVGEVLLLVYAVRNHVNKYICASHLSLLLVMFAALLSFDTELSLQKFAPYISGLATLNLFLSIIYSTNQFRKIKFNALVTILSLSVILTATSVFLAMVVLVAGLVSIG